MESPINNIPYINISDPNNIKSAFSKDKNKFSQQEQIKNSRKTSDFSAGAADFSSTTGNQIINNNKFSFSSNNVSNFNPNLLQSPFDLNSKSYSKNNDSINNHQNKTCITDLNNANSSNKAMNMLMPEKQPNNDLDGLSMLQRNLSLLEKNFILNEKINEENKEIENDIKIINENDEDLNNQNSSFKEKEELKESKYENLLEIKIKTSEGNTEFFSIQKQFCTKPELLKKNLSEFIENKKLNKNLFYPIIARINESVFSLNEILQQKINKKFLEDFKLLEKNKTENNNINDLNNSEDLELEEILNKNFFSDDNKKLQKLISLEEISDEDSDLENNFEKEKINSFLLFNRTSVSTCQSDDEDEAYCDLLLNKTL